MPTIIIAEKPVAAQHISEALAEKNLRKKSSNEGVPWWEFERDGKKFITVAAVGHLFGLKQKKGVRDYPIFDVEWVPNFSANKKAFFSKKYFELIEKFKGAGDDFIIACDFDNEGTVIGFNILKFIFGKEEAKRMKFSTLTKQDLVKSFQEIMPKIDFQNLECGYTRHIVDFYYGINISRGLMEAIKKASPRFMILSAGRVQGPVLTMLSEREKQILAFKPTPFWQLQALLLLDGKETLAEHLTDKFWKKPEAENALKNSQAKNANALSAEKKEHLENPPVPFNITSLQTESYKLFGYSPQQTMQFAQSLYTAAFISYPRTSSEKLPPQIGYRETLEALGKIPKYKKLVQKLLALPALKPTEGKRDDPAHEAIHPTVQPPDLEKLKGTQKNIYDLIARRFFAIFGEPALREGMKIIFNIGKEQYKVLGRRTLKPGWIEFYGPLAKFDETALPELKKGDSVPVKKIEMLDKETQPPSRWSQASIIKEMEKRGLGTRATRSAILQTLYDRKYVSYKSIRVTDLGMKVAGTLKEFVPDFVDEQMTKALEEDMEKILSGKSEQKKIVDAAKRHVRKICEELKENEDKIGKNLGSAIIATQEDANTLGPCPKCEGGTLKVLFSIFTKKHFVGCSNYSHCAVCNFTKKACKCKCGICEKEKGKCADEWKAKEWKPKCATGFPLPHQASFQRLDKICDKCKTPMIKVLRKGKRPFNMCLEPNCPTKADWGKKDNKKVGASGKRKGVRKKI